MRKSNKSAINCINPNMLPKVGRIDGTLAVGMLQFVPFDCNL